MKRYARMPISAEQPGVYPDAHPALPGRSGDLLALSAPVAAEITKAPASKTKQAIKVETFAKGLVHPWGLAFLPDGRLLVTERPGRVRIVGKDGKLSAPLQGVPEGLRQRAGRAARRRAGPDFAASGARLSLLRRAARRQQQRHQRRPRQARRRGRRRAARRRAGDLPAGAVATRRASISARASSSRATASLFVTLGDRYSARDEAQNPANHLGKLVRIMPDGSPLRRQPQEDRLAAGDLVDRPPQRAGRGAQPRDRQAVDHRARRARRRRDQRARSRQELRLAGDHLRPRLHATSRSARARHKAGHGAADLLLGPLDRALRARRSTPATCFPEWKGNLFVGALAGQALHRLVLDGEKIVGEEKLLADLGERIRDVRNGPDGALWLLTDDPQGRVLRVVPGTRISPLLQSPGDARAPPLPMRSTGSDAPVDRGIRGDKPGLPASDRRPFSLTSAASSNTLPAIPTARDDEPPPCPWAIGTGRQGGQRPPARSARGRACVLGRSRCSNLCQIASRASSTS